MTFELFDLLQKGLSPELVRNYARQKNEPDLAVLLLEKGPRPWIHWCDKIFPLLQPVATVLAVVVFFVFLGIVAFSSPVHHMSLPTFLGGILAVGLISFTPMVPLIYWEKFCYKKYYDEAHWFAKDFDWLIRLLSLPNGCVDTNEITRKSDEKIYGLVVLILTEEQVIRDQTKSIDDICAACHRRVELKQKLESLHRAADQFGLVDSIGGYYQQAGQQLFQR